MYRLMALPTARLALPFGGTRGQDVMRLNLPVLRYAPLADERVPIHSHPNTVAYVLKGRRVRYTLPDGTTRDAPLNATGNRRKE